MSDDYEVVWAGKGAMPHEERDRGYWVQKQNVLLDHAPATSHYLEVAERAAAKTGPKGPRKRCACGKAIKAEAKQIQCNGCRNAGRQSKRKVA